MPRRPANAEKALYPIRTVASITGVNPVTLRAWERRYGLIKPVRTAGGQRMYTREHIDRVTRLLAMRDKGLAMSQAARNLASTESQALPGDFWASLRERMKSAVVRFDEPALDDAYNEALSLHPLALVTRKLLVPLLEELGTRWESSEGSVAEEHFFAMYVRNKLGARFHHRTRLLSGPRVLTACAPAEQHEIGLLLFALEAHEAGLRCVLLGASTPLSDMPHAMRQSGCDALIVSGYMAPGPEILEVELPRVVAAIGRPVFFGGRASVTHRDAIARAGAVALGVDIPRSLKRIRTLLAGGGKRS